MLVGQRPRRGPERERKSERKKKKKKRKKERKKERRKKRRIYDGAVVIVYVFVLEWGLGVGLG